MNSDMPQQKIQVQILPQDDWGGNTTAMTADFSDFNDECGTEAGGRSSQYYGKYDPEHDTANGGPADLDYYGGGGGGGEDRWPPNSVSTARRSCWSGKLCTFTRHYFGYILATALTMISLLTPVLFITLPKIVNLGSTDGSLYSASSVCGIECEGLLVSISFKLLVLLIGAWVIFARRPRATLPKVNELRALLLVLLSAVTATFWLFYAARVLHTSSVTLISGYVPFDYLSVLQFSSNNVDVLLFVFILSVFVVELRHLRNEFVVTVYRSPDGEQRTYSLGRMSVQRASLWLLEQYYRDFKVYNPWLETARHKRAIQLMQAAEQQQQQQLLLQQQQQNVSKQQRRRANMSATSSATNFKNGNNTNGEHMMDSNNMMDNVDAQSTVSAFKKNSSKAMSRNQSQLGMDLFFIKLNISRI
jgi:hypothetical protein